VQGVGTDPGLVRFDRTGSVAVLVLAHPPVNTLTGPVQAALLAALQVVEADASISAVILRGEGRVFSAGVDIREAGQAARRAELAALCRRVEEFPRPVIAALHGTALGAGCELALAAHYRIANASAVLGLPEVGLGLVPGAGATQRLPRLVGAEAALQVMLSGAPLRAAEALVLGLVDRVVSENLGEAALAMAVEGLGPRPTRDRREGFRDMLAYQAAVARARAVHKFSPLPAPARIIDCIEAAALLPYDMGLAMEATAFEDLAATPQAHGLRHAFQAERRALQPPALDQTGAGQALPVVQTLGVWGAGDPATALAHQALAAGLGVVLCDESRPRLADALGRIAALQDQAVAAGHLTEDARDSAWAHLSSAMTVQALAGLDLIVRAEGLDLPQAAVLGAAAGPGDVGITVPEGAGGLAELSCGAAAVPDLIARLVALGRRLQWRVVTVGPGGPVELGLRLALDAAERHLMATGQTPEAVTAALRAFGLGGPVTSALPAMPRGGGTIVQACLAAMAAEGARMLADGRARRPCDIDSVALLSGLVPRWQGGPMFLADQRGLMVLRADLRKWDDPVFAVPDLLDALIADGRRFGDLDLA
jgi:3-hydroxyacyl-CoA dehydrogenase